MSLENAERFLHAMSTDPAVVERLLAVRQPGHMIETAVEIGRERGWLFTADELAARLDEVSATELADDHLRSVAGGFGALTSAFSQAIKSLGEGLSTVARKA
jgi:predicted ribosomally synthesized peptide with nif11-like leader